MTIRSILAFGAAAALLASGAPALAKTGVPDAGSPVSVVVPLRDLNLDTQAGAETALRRIAAATRETCGDLSASNLPLAERAMIRRCRKAAIESAVAVLNQPSVSARAQQGDWAKLADN